LCWRRCARSYRRDNNGWVITDSATGEILGLPPGPPFDLDGAGPGLCDIWYIRYTTGTTGIATGNNISDIEGCFDLSNPIVVTRLTGDDCDVLSVETVDLGQAFNMFPNPSNGVVEIQLTGVDGTFNVALYDINGRLVQSNEIDAQSNNSIDVADLSSGIYLVKLTNNETGNTTIKRLVRS